MNTLDPSNLPLADNTVQQIKFPKTKKAERDMSKPHNGMDMWEVDIKTGTAEKIKIKVSSLPQKEKTKNPFPRLIQDYAEKTLSVIDVENIHHKVDAREGFWYVWAINKTNAEKKFKKAFQGTV
jgi:hypothetical protein